jgi:osmotically-inducible protein OsmY
LKMSYKNYSINIHVLDGVVTVTGTVPTSQDKHNVEMDISGIKGVKKVVNNLEAKNTIPKVNNGKA